MNEQERQEQIELMRKMDPGKAGINGCDGYFEPENREPHGARRPGKTYEDRIPADRRNRVAKAKARADRMQATGH